MEASVRETEWEHGGYTVATGFIDANGWEMMVCNLSKEAADWLAARINASGPQRPPKRGPGHGSNDC